MDMLRRFAGSFDKNRVCKVDIEDKDCLYDDERFDKVDSRVDILESKFEWWDFKDASCASTLRISS